MPPRRLGDVRDDVQVWAGGEGRSVEAVAAPPEGFEFTSRSEGLEFTSLPEESELTSPPEESELTSLPEELEFTSLPEE